jgi:ethanolamine permease
LIIGAVIGYVFALLIHYTGSDSPVGAALLNMAVFGAVIAYILQMLSFILLRYRFPNMERPYKSPLGVIGALFALLISLITLVALFIVEPAYRAAVVGAAIWFAAGVLWFACVGRKRLVKTPEEAFALRKARD